MYRRLILQYASTQLVGEALLWLLIAFVPWPFGAVSAASEGVVGLLVTGLGLCLVWRFMFEKREFVGAWAPAPLLALLAVVLLSMVPLPDGLVSFLSPRGAQIRQELTAHLPADAVHPGKMTLSFYPLATAHMARLMIGSMIVFLAVINFCRSAAAVLRLMIAVAVVGGALGAEAVLQTISSNGQIYWRIPAPVKATSGPFVNYNNYSQFMNLTIGAGLGLLLNLVHRRVYQGRSHALLGRWELLGDSGRRHVMLLFVMLLLAGLSILLSTSRGGVLAMIGAGLFTAVLLASMREMGMPLKLLSLVGLALTFVLLSLGLDRLGPFLDRMGTLSDLASASGARRQVFSDVAQIIPQFAVVGTGLGTHEYVYPMFSRLTTWRNAQYVENEYLQLAEEMGAVGVALMACFIGLMAANFIRAIRRRDLGLGYAALGLGFGLVAAALGSITDFGQRIASVSSLTAVVCGLIVAIGRIDNDTEIPRPARRLRQPAALAISLPLLAAMAWMLLGVSHAAMAEYHWNQVLPLEDTVIRQDWKGSQDQFTTLIRHAQAATDWEPGNVEYRTWLAIYHWHNGLRDASWNSMGEQQRIEMFQNLVQEFQNCERLCPTYGLSYAMAGQIRYMALHDAGGAEEIRQAYRLAPTHRAVCFIAGRLSVGEGKWDEACEQFSRALALHYPDKNEVLNVYVKEADRPDLAVEVFKDDWETLGVLAGIVAREPVFANLAPGIQARSQAVLTAEAQKPDAGVRTLAAMADLAGRQGDLAAAIRYYRRAIDGSYGNGQASYGNAQWHFALAKILAQKGDAEAARQELVVALRQNSPALSEEQRQIADQLRWNLSHPASQP